MSAVGIGSPSLLRPRRSPRRIVVAYGDAVRSFTVRPWLAVGAVGVGVVFGILYLAATGYLFFRDDILAASLTHQTRMQDAYEDRITALRATIDRLTSRQLLDQQAFDAKMDRLLNRQAALDARQDIIAGLSQAARRAGLNTGQFMPKAAVVPTDPKAGDAKDQAAAPVKADPMVTGSIAPNTVGTHASLAVAMLRTAPVSEKLPATPIDLQIKSAETSLDQLAGAQVAYVDAVAGTVAHRNDKIGTVLARLGQKLPPSHGNTEDVGGPFIPLDKNADPDTFRSGVALVSGQLERLAMMKRLAKSMPLSRPIPNAVITSRFGPRLDPFLGRPAMHPGIDFRAPIGYPVRATAPGKVISAGYDGGYGNMVEIDHGHGITTRYGHMSKLLVTVGQTVAKGDLLGRAGSTGRSTGPHLHYEVRVDGEAVDPMQFIKAGSELASLL